MPLTPTYNRLAVDVPPFMERSGMLKDPFGGNPEAGIRQQEWIQFSSSLLGWQAHNRNTLRQDYLGLFGDGFGVAWGMELVEGIGLSAVITAGAACIGGPVILESDLSLDAYLTPGVAHAYVWLTYAGTPVVVPDDPTPPVDLAVYLGELTTDATDVTAIDYSGRQFAFFNISFRETADVATPTDSPSTKTNFIHYSNNGGGSGSFFWWVGKASPSGAYAPFVSTSTLVGLIPPVNADYVVGTANATLTNELVLGSQVIMRGTFGAIPAASLSGRLYFATDLGTLFRDTGSAWEQIAAKVASAPDDAQYVTLALSAGLTSERVLTAGTNISITDGGAGGAVTITGIPKKKLVPIVLAAAYTPTATGGDTAEYEVPYGNGGASLTYDVVRRYLRLGTPGGTPAVTFEKYNGTGAFSATSIGSVAASSGARKAIDTTAGSTVASGDLIRFNVTDVGVGAQDWTIMLFLEEQ